MEEKKKESCTELQKPNIETDIYSNNKKRDWIYTYTCTPICKSKHSNNSNKKYNRSTQRTKETKNYIYQNKTK